MLHVNYPTFYRRRKHDRCRSNSVRHKPVYHLLQMLDRTNSDLHYERITARAAMTFEYLVRFLYDLDDVAVIHARDAHSDKRRYRQANLRCIDLGTIAGDDPSVF